MFNITKCPLGYKCAQINTHTHILIIGFIQAQMKIMLHLAGTKHLSIGYNHGTV